MFKVQDTRSGEIKIVYAVCGTTFMFYDCGVWYYDHMEYYEPAEE